MNKALTRSGGLYKIGAGNVFDSVHAAAKTAVLRHRKSTRRQVRAATVPSPDHAAESEADRAMVGLVRKPGATHHFPKMLE